jgi:hypothetical protein
MPPSRRRSANASDRSRSATACARIRKFGLPVDHPAPIMNFFSAYPIRPPAFVD